MVPRLWHQLGLSRIGSAADHSKAQLCCIVSQHVRFVSICYYVFIPVNPYPVSLESYVPRLLSFLCTVFIFIFVIIIIIITGHRNVVYVV